MSTNDNYFFFKIISFSKSGSFYRTTNFTMENLSNFTYTGLCTANSERVTLEIDFENDWRLELYFYKINQTFLFNHIVLYYKFAGPLFPNSLHKGAQSEIYDFAFINSTIDKSYVCNSGLIIDLGNVLLSMQNIKIDPYFKQKPNKIFESEISCPNDNPMAEAQINNSIWIQVIIIALVLISIVFILFVAFRICDSCNTDKKTSLNQNDDLNDE